MTVSARDGRTLFALYGVIAAFYGALVALWLVQSPLYPALLKTAGINPVIAAGPSYAHPPMPFFDLEGVISWSECARKGVDVYRTNTCDPAPYRRPANYSPLLPDLPLEWIGTQRTLAAGTILSGAFLLLLPWLLRPRNGWEFAVSALACTSQAVFYAAERANIDIVVFTAIAAAALLGRRSSRARAGLYATAIAATLIKFYPVVVLVAALRERPRVLWRIAAGSAVAFVPFVWWYFAGLVRATANLPRFVPFSDMFGAAALPLSLWQRAGVPAWACAMLGAVLLAAFACGAWRSSCLAEKIIRPRDWFRPPMLLLLCGGAVMVACFLLQTNNAYRAIFLVLTLPGFFALTRQSRLYAWTCYGVLVCLWAEVGRANLARLFGTDAAHGVLALLPYGYYAGRELVWWSVAAATMGIVLAFLRQTPPVRSLVSIR